MTYRDPRWPALARIWRTRERVAVDDRQGLTPRLLDGLGKLEGRVLVIGAGAGLVPLALAERGHDVTAVDSCSEMLALCAERFRAAGRRAELVLGPGHAAPVSGEFGAVIVSTGVITRNTLDAPEAAKLLERLPSWLAPEGRAHVAYCAETADNAPYRQMYRDLGLGLDPSNNRWLVAPASLAELRARFAHDPRLDPTRIEPWLAADAPLVRAQSRMVQALAVDLRAQGEDADEFVARELGYQKPYLDADAEGRISTRLRAFFGSVTRLLLADSETVVQSSALARPRAV